ncbi:hypothetical protein QL285_077921 [Trifolium repens]|nr:hypothetical protein QL285_077921 [Trifolium repens]
MNKDRTFEIKFKIRTHMLCCFHSLIHISVFDYFTVELPIVCNSVVMIPLSPKLFSSQFIHKVQSPFHPKLLRYLDELTLIIYCKF